EPLLIDRHRSALEHRDRAVTPATTAPHLAVRDPLGHRLVTLDKPSFTIGRRDGNDLQLAGTEVSRDHAEIVSTPDGFVVRDRGSRYGTFVNQERVAE